MTRPSRKEIGKVEISTSPCLRVPSPVVEEGGGGVGWGWGGGEGGAAIWGGGAVDAGYVDEFLASALTRVMRAPVPIPAVAAVSVLHSVVVRGSVVGVVGPSRHLGSLTAANWVSFDFNVACSSC